MGKRRRFWTPENRLITLREIEDETENQLETDRKAEANRSQAGNGAVRAYEVKIAVEWASAVEVNEPTIFGNPES